MTKIKLKVMIRTNEEIANLLIEGERLIGNIERLEEIYDDKLDNLNEQINK